MVADADHDTQDREPTEPGEEPEPHRRLPSWDEIVFNARPDGTQPTPVADADHDTQDREPTEPETGPEKPEPAEPETGPEKPEPAEPETGPEKPEPRRRIPSWDEIVFGARPDGTRPTPAPRRPRQEEDVTLGLPMDMVESASHDKPHRDYSDPLTPMPWEEEPAPAQERVIDVVEFAFHLKMHKDRSGPPRPDGTQPTPAPRQEDTAPDQGTVVVFPPRSGRAWASGATHQQGDAGLGTGQGAVDPGQGHGGGGVDAGVDDDPGAGHGHQDVPHDTPGTR